MNKIFQKQVVLISGGLGDIGRAITLAFASEGASVAIGDIRPAQEAEALLAEITSQGVQAHYRQVDVAQPEEVAGWIGAVENALGTPQIVISNAATVTIAGIETVSDQQWANEIDINLNGSFYLSRTAASRMIAAQIPGRILFVGSWAAHAVHPNLPAYSVSKAGVRMLCKCMALELAPHQILVNEIAPGYVEAGLSASIWKTAPELAEQARQRVPVKKLITTREVARQVLHLCHPDNVHMTGSTLLMDGGLSLLT